MLYISARFNGKCFETALPIKKGDTVLYCPDLKKIFHINSPSARAFDAEQAEKQERANEKNLVANGGWAY